MGHPPALLCFVTLLLNIIVSQALHVHACLLLLAWHMAIVNSNLWVCPFDPTDIIIDLQDDRHGALLSPAACQAQSSRI